MAESEFKTPESARTHAAVTLEDDGISYAVQDYCDPETYEADPRLEELWRDAAVALGMLETYLHLNTIEGGSQLTDRSADLKNLGVTDEKLDTIKFLKKE